MTARSERDHAHHVLRALRLAGHVPDGAWRRLVNGVVALESESDIAKAEAEAMSIVWQVEASDRLTPPRGRWRHVPLAAAFVNDEQGTCLPTCTHGYNGTATFGWRDGRSQFIRADDRVIVSESVSDDPTVRDMYEVRDRCSDLPGMAYHAKKWSDR